MSLRPGTRLGPYEIVAFLGADGMGEVYRARDVRLDRTFAIKILRAPEAEKSEAKERFDREARAISSLNHPNICHLCDVGQQEGISYLVMEYNRASKHSEGGRFLACQCSVSRPARFC
jgi:eukaryotic-like serine/threonine-protein kinase